MDAPPVRYATTSDGVSIAWSEQGVGPPLVTTMLPFGMVEGWDAVAPAWRGLARSFRVISYDPRGAGLSDRSAVDFSMSAMQRDLDAVVPAGAPAVVLFGPYDAVPVMVTYAATHPDRVSYLILSDGWVRFSDQQQSASFQTMMVIMDADWTHATDTFGRVLTGIDDPKRAGSLAEYVRGSISRDAFRASQLALADWRVEHLLSEIVAPTLVLHSRRNPWQPVSAGQRIAAGIRGAQFQVLEDAGSERRVQLVEEFVLGRSKAAPAFGGSSGTAVILFVDIADSTALTERIGDASFRARAREIDASMRASVREHDGVVIDAKTLGDGILATFPAASEVIAAALACAEIGTNAGLPLHVGLHAGDVIREDNNVYGGAVNIAARIASASAADEILVSATVRDLARTSAGVVFENRGEVALKGVSEPQRVYAVRPRQ